MPGARLPVKVPTTRRASKTPGPCGLEFSYRPSKFLKIRVVMLLGLADELSSLQEIIRDERLQCLIILRDSTSREHCLKHSSKRHSGGCNHTRVRRKDSRLVVLQGTHEANGDK